MAVLQNQGEVQLIQLQQTIVRWRLLLLLFRLDLDNILDIICFDLQLLAVFLVWIEDFNIRDNGPNRLGGSRPGVP